MKVLMISLDRTCLREGSSQREKLLRYGALFDELHVVIFYSGTRLPDRLECAPNVFVYPTNHFFRFNPFYFYRAFRIASRVIRRRQFTPSRDVVTAQDSFPTGVVAYALKIAFGISFQLQIHIDFFNPYFVRESLWHRLQAACARFLAPRADGVRVVSNGIARYVREELAVDPRKISIVPVTPDMRAIADAEPRFDLRARYPQFPFIALMACRLVKQKGAGRALDAMRILARTHPEAGLIIVGSGPEEWRLKRTVVDMGLKNVIFVPWAEDVVSYYKGADVFLLPSLYEGWGLTVVEAMAAGLPVIATPVGCVPDLIDSGKNGFILPTGSPLEIADAIGMLCADSGLAKKIGRAAEASVFARMPYTAGAYELAYKNALSYAISG